MPLHVAPGSCCSAPCVASQKGEGTQEEQPEMQIIALLSKLDVENNLSMIQSTETVTKLELKTSPSPVLQAHGWWLR